MWGSRKAASEGLLPGRAVVGPLAIMALTPLAAVLFVYCNVHLRGSLTALFTELLNDPVSIVQAAWRTPTWPAIKILLVWSGFQLALMRWMPGSEYLGPITPTGNVPRYRANGFQSFVATLVVYLLGAHYFHWFDPSEIYFYYDQMICAMCMFSFALCAGLYVKGLHAPSSSDSGSTGNPVMDFYWGTELYPRILGWDVKQFTNCRFGMMAWTILPLVFAHKHMELHGELGHAMAVNVILQLVYTAKSVYVSQSMYMVQHRGPGGAELPTSWALAYLLLGWACIYANYDADAQRAAVRRADGAVSLWGAPAKERRVYQFVDRSISSPVETLQVIRASYTTEGGVTKHTLLLASGWWGISRHIHYLPEILASFFWSVPAGFDAFMPYFYTCFLVILLLDRSFRDDKRCAAKYGTYWKQYCELVPYKIVPGVL